MSDSNNAELRKYRALRRLGSENPKCFTCGEDDWRCLEAHHIAGKRHDPSTIVVCRNDHRKLSDDQLDHPVDLPSADPLLTRIAHFLLGLADALALVIERLRAFAADLTERSAVQPAAANGGQS